MTGNKHWVEQYYVYELVLFLMAFGFLYFGYALTYTLYNYIGAGFICFGMILSLIQKRGGIRQ